MSFGPNTNPIDQPNAAGSTGDIAVIHNDGVFDSGAQPVGTSATLATVARRQPRGRRLIASLVVGPQTIGSLAILQSATCDDPNPVTIATGAGINQPALADLSYVFPAMTFPLAAGSVYQIHFQGDAAEIIIQAASAGGAGATLQVRGTAVGRRDDC
jgi:hypothetical protein